MESVSTSSHANVAAADHDDRRASLQCLTGCDCDYVGEESDVKINDGNVDHEEDSRILSIPISSPTQVLLSPATQSQSKLLQQQYFYSSNDLVRQMPLILSSEYRLDTEADVWALHGHTLEVGLSYEYGFQPIVRMVCLSQFCSSVETQFKETEWSNFVSVSLEHRFRIFFQHSYNNWESIWLHEAYPATNVIDVNFNDQYGTVQTVDIRKDGRQLITVTKEEFLSIKLMVASIQDEYSQVYSHQQHQPMIFDCDMTDKVLFRAEMIATHGGDGGMVINCEHKYHEFNAYGLLEFVRKFPDKIVYDVARNRYQ